MEGLPEETDRLEQDAPNESPKQEIESQETMKDTQRVELPQRPLVYGIDEYNISDTFNTDGSQDISSNHQKEEHIPINRDEEAENPSLSSGEAEAIQDQLTTLDEHIPEDNNTKEYQASNLNQEEPLCIEQQTTEAHYDPQIQSDALHLNQNQERYEEEQPKPISAKEEEPNPIEEEEEHIQPDNENENVDANEVEEVPQEVAELDLPPVEINTDPLPPPKPSHEFTPEREIAAVLEEGNAIMRSILEQIRNIRKLADLTA